MRHVEIDRDWSCAHVIVVALMAAVACVSSGCEAASDRTYDTVIRGGRIIDPETGFDGLVGLTGILLFVSVSAVSAEDDDLRKSAAKRPESGGTDFQAPAGATLSIFQTHMTDFERFAAAVDANASAIGGAPALPPTRSRPPAPQTNATDFERFAASVGVDVSTIGEELGRGKPNPSGAEMMAMIFCPVHQRMERRPTASFTPRWARGLIKPLASQANHDRSN